MEEDEMVLGEMTRQLVVWPALDARVEHSVRRALLCLLMLSGLGTGSCDDSADLCNLQAGGCPIAGLNAGLQGDPCAQGGALLTRPSGVFDDGSPGNYSSNLNCQWTISVEGAEAIVLQFEMFDTEQGYDLLTIFDQWRTVVSAVSGTFDRADLVGELRVVGSTARLEFTTDEYTNGDGFRVRYRAEMPGTTSPDQDVTWQPPNDTVSPWPDTASDPTTPSQDLSGTWTGTLSAMTEQYSVSAHLEQYGALNEFLSGSFTTANGRSGEISGTIHGSMVDVELWFMDPCGGSARGTVDVDFDPAANVTVMTGLFEVDDCIGMYEGELVLRRDVPICFGDADCSAGNVCVTGVCVPQAPQPAPGCAGITWVQGEMGEFDDGSGPFPYANNLDCGWLIMSPAPTAYFSLSFQLVDLRPNDVVRVFAGADPSAPLVAEITGDQTVEFEAGAAFIEFATDDLGTGQGWLVAYYMGPYGQ